MTTYAFDTHALVYWVNRQCVGERFLHFFDECASQGNLVVSTICFWEIALLVKKGRLRIGNLGRWKDDLLRHSGIRLDEPSVDEMIASTQLPDLHKDPLIDS